MSQIQSFFPSASSKFQSIVSKQEKGWKSRLFLIWALLGPGLIAAMADNDAGGVISYTATGAQFGIGLFIPLVICLAPLTFTIQEMSMRLCAVTQEGFSRLALKRYGKFWGYYHISTLAFENLLTLITEFIGMTAGLVLLGLPLLPSTLICLALIIIFVIFTGYWTKERIALFVGLLNVVFLVVAGHYASKYGSDRACIRIMECSACFTRYCHLVCDSHYRKCDCPLDDFLSRKRND